LPPLWLVLDANVGVASLLKPDGPCRPSRMRVREGSNRLQKNTVSSVSLVATVSNESDNVLEAYVNRACSAPSLGSKNGRNRFVINASAE
jgi:hypothetical protein